MPQAGLLDVAYLLRVMTASYATGNATASPAAAASTAEERFRLLVESVKDYAIISLDPEGYVNTWNPGAERIQGYTATEIIGKHFSVFYPPAVVAAGRCTAELEIAQREGRFEAEVSQLRKDGSQIWANVAVTPLRDPNGTLVGFARVTQDLTERRAAEEEARRFRLLVQSVKDYAIFILDPNGIVTTWNPGAQHIKGFTAEQIIGRHFSTFYPEEVRYTGKCEAELELAARVGRFEEEGYRLRQDGSLFWAKVIITALRDPSGTLIGFAKVTQDLTSRKEAEENERALAAQRAALAEKARIQEFQERFLAILGHDLRNPLAAIDMAAALLSQHVTEPAAQRVLDRMRSSSSRMTRMITQILDLTRSRLAGGLEMVRAPMDLSVALQQIVEEMRSAFPGHSIRLDAPSIRGVWDQDRLEQVFSNLIGNAVTHGDAHRPVTVQATARPKYVEVTIHNYGEPISPEAQATLFSAFRRGERDSRTAKTAGLGLGLFISHEIVRGHGGAISLESNAEQGTTFRLTLPLSETAGE